MQVERETGGLKMMSKEEIEAEANDWIRSQGWSEETLPSDEYNQMVSAYVAGHYDGFQKGIKAKINTTTISDCPIKDERFRKNDD